MYNYEDINNIELKGKFIGDVMFKPTTPIIITVICGVICLIVKPILAKFLGAFFLALAGVVQYGVKDHKVISVYDDCILIYKDANTAAKVPLADIKEWNTNMSQQYKVVIKLTNGATASIETYRMDQADKLLRDLMPEKNTVNVIQERTKNITFKASNPAKNIKKVITTIKDKFK